MKQRLEYISLVVYHYTEGMASNNELLIINYIKSVVKLKLAINAESK